MTNVILHMDCIEGMAAMPSACIDMVLTDLPYVNTKYDWDKGVPLDEMWVALKRVVKPGGAMVFTGIQPFTTKLISSNLRMFRHTLVWNKVLPMGFLNAKKMPLRVHEDIIVFADRTTVYNPKMQERGRPRKKGSARVHKPEHLYKIKNSSDTFNNLYYPTSIITVSNAVNKDKIHPTQKPVALFQQLIETYSNPGATVLDICMGSGTTAIACINSGRSYVGFENNETFYNRCMGRVNSYVPPALDSAP